MRLPRSLLVTHMFIHQTHHRGLVLAALSWFGLDPGYTYIPFVLLDAHALNL